MAMQLPDFTKAPLQDTVATNFSENLLKGYKMAQEPDKMAAEKKEKDLANKMKAKALEHYDENYNLDKQLKQAQIKKANRPAALKGAMARAFQLRDSLDPQSPNYEKDLKAVDKYIDKLGTNSKGVQVTSSPEGGFEVSIGGQGETAQVPGFPGLKKGEVPLYDKQGAPVGIGKPFTPAEAKEESGRQTFNVWQKFLTEAQAPYTGKGSNKRFLNDIKNYSKDPEAKSRIDNLIAADSLVFSTTVKEEATLGGANTNQAYNRLTHSLEKSEIYPKLRNLAQYNLPEGYIRASNDIFNKKINEGTQAGKDIPAYKPYYFNQNHRGSKVNTPPEAALKKGFNANAPKPHENPVIKGTKNGITTIEYGNDVYEVPEKHVDAFMVKYSKAKFGDTYGE